MPNAFDQHPTLEQLAEFDSGELAAPLWKAVEDHVATCESCCRRLESLPADILTCRMRTARFDGDTFPEATALPEELLDHPRYRILDLLGIGGMGAVYLAEHRLMNRLVALKTMRKSLLKNPTAVEQFRIEATAAARLSHPNIVAAFDADQAGDTHFLVLEFVPGERFDRIVDRLGPLPIAEACEAVRQAALGLEHARENGMVHRDIKPQNLLRTPDGIVKILDFGLATFAREAQRQPESGASAPAVAGPITGTPDFIAPEQAVDPGSADIRSDIYSLGGTFRFLLTGKPPFPEKKVADKIDGHLRRNPEPIESLRPDVPPAVLRIVDRMLARDPQRRYATPAEVADDLGAWLASARSRKPIARRLPAAILAVAGGISVAVLAAILWVRTPADSNSTTVAALPTPTPPPKKHDIELSDRVPPPDAPAKAAPKADGKSQLDAMKRIAAWIRDNNVRGPEHQIAVDLTTRADQILAKGNALECYIGGDLLKSRQSTVLAAIRNELFVLPMNAEQVQARKLGSREMAVIGLNPPAGPTDPEPIAVLHDLRIDDADAIVPGKSITGSVRIRRSKEGGENFALQMFAGTGNRISSTGTSYLENGLPDADGVVSFHFRAPDLRPNQNDVFVVFLELIRMTTPHRVDTSIVTSRPVAQIVKLADQ